MLNRLFNSLSDGISDYEATPEVPAAERIHALEEELELLRSVISNFPGGLSLIDKNLKLVFCNERQKELLDYPPYLFEFGTPTLEQLFRFNATRGEYGPGNIEDLVRTRMELVKQRRAHVFERTRPNGTVLEIRGVPLKGGGFMTTYLDVTDRRNSTPEPRQNQRPDADKLTGLLRKPALIGQLNEILIGLRPGQVAALHCMDLDHFKQVNAKYGRATGDKLIQGVAESLRGLTRGTDLIARVGGDRFVVVQTNVLRPSDVTRLAGRILEAVREPVTIGNEVIQLSTSIGLALAPRDGHDPKTLLAKAEAAVMATKSRNRGGFEAETASWN